jgi:hypothetical protein
MFIFIATILFLLSANNLFSQTNYSLYFDGTNDYVNVNDAATLDVTGSYTIEAWIRPSTFSFLRGIVSKYHSPNSRGPILRLTPTSPYTGIDAAEFSSSNGLLTANTWYHVASVISGSNVSIYINGSLAASGTTSYVTQANSDPLRIGVDYLTDGNRYWSGYIDEVRIWNTALSSGTISTWRNQLVTASHPNYSNLKGYWKFDEGSGTSATDGSGNGNTGTLMNGVAYSYTTPTLSGYSPFSLSATSINFGNVPTGNTSQNTVTVTNTGGSTITISSVTSNDGNFSVSPTSGSINAGGNMVFTITFAPSSAGSKSGTITFTHNALGSPHTVSVSGTGLGPTFSASPTSLNLGNVQLGSSKTDSITVTNVGGNTLTISNVTSSDAHFTVTPTTSGALANNQSQQFYVTFTPTAAGNVTTTLSFTHNGTGSPSNISAFGSNSGHQLFALRLDGTDDRVSSNQYSQTILGTNWASTKTVEVWCKPMGAAPVVSYGYQGANILGDNVYFGIYHANIGGQDKIWVYNYDGNDDKIAIDYTMNEWVHIALVHSGGMLYAYKNGTLVNSVSSSSTYSNSYLEAGYGSNNYKYFNGIIEEGRVWNVALSAGTIQTYYNEEVTNMHPNYSGLKVYWKFNEGTGATTADASGNGYTGTLYNNPTWLVSDAPFSPPSPFTLSKSSIDFGNIAVGTSKTDSVITGNTGTSAITISSVTSSQGNFSVTPVSGVIPPSGSKTFYITYTRTSTTQNTGSITFTHSAPGSPKSVSVSGGQIPIIGGAGKAIRFTASGQVVNSGSYASAILGSGFQNNKTIEVWCKPMAAGPTVSNAYTGNLVFGDQFYFGIYHATIGGQDMLWVNNYNTNGVEERVGVPYTIGQWVHIALVHSGGYLMIYKNGSYYSYVVNSLNSYGSYYVAAGQAYYGTYFNGEVDEARMWNVGLSYTDIGNYYNQVITSSHPYYNNLKLYWKFDEGTGSQTDDASLNNFVGSFYGSPVWVNSGAGIVGGTTPPGTFTINATTSSGGTISPFGTVSVDSNSSITFTFTPDTDYHIDSVYVDGSYIGIPTSYTFNNVVAPHTIRVVFASTIPIFATAGTNGSINPSGAVQVFPGNNQSFIITANGGYHIDSVLVDGVDVGPVTIYTFSNVVVTHTIHAVFAPDPPVFAVAPDSVDFDRVNVNEAKIETVVVTNNGTASLVISSASSDNARFTVNPSSATINGGATRAFSITFIPNANGEQTGTISFTDNANGSPHSVFVSGKGVTPLFAVAPNNLTYGSVRVGENKVDSVVISNSGDGILNVNSVSSDNENYSVSPTSATIDSNASKTFYITFAPTIVGEINATITFDHNASPTKNKITISNKQKVADVEGKKSASTSTTSTAQGQNTVSVSGTGIAPSWSVSPTTLSYGNILVGTSQSDSVTVSNNGTASLTIASVISSDAQFTITPANATIDVNGTQTFVLSFAPTSVGVKTSDVIFVHNASGSPDTVVVDGNGIAPEFSASSGSINLGDVLVGTTNTDSVIVTNTGTATLNISNVASDNNQFTVTPATSSLEPNASQTFTMTFAPTSPGTKNGNISFTHDANGSPSVVEVSGTGTAPMFSSVASKNVGYAVINNSRVDSITVTNTGTAPLNISNVSSSNAVFSVTPASASLDPNVEMKFYITFSPTLTGVQTTNLTFTHDAINSPSEIGVSGIGVVAGFFVDPATVAFNDVLLGFSKVDSVLVSNTDVTPLTISSVISDNADFTVNPTSTVLAPSASMKFYITFAPSQLGVSNGTISFTHSASVEAGTVTVSGNGVTPEFSVAPASVSFGDVVIGHSKTDSVAVSNPGTATLIISSITSNNNKFTVSPTNNAVAPNETKQIYFTFSPSDTGIQNATITFTDNASGSPHTVTVNGRGTIPVFTISPSAISYGNVRVGQEKVDSVSVTNPGTATLIVSEATSNSDQYSVVPTSANIVPNETKQFYITYSPTTTGIENGILSFSHNASGSPHTVTVDGNGVTPIFGFSKVSTDFGEIVPAVTMSDSFSVSNTGTASLNISAVTSTNSRFTITPTTGTVNIGGTMMFYVSYTPTSLTEDTGKISFVHDASGSPSVFTATGIGLGGAFASSKSAMTFGDVAPLIGKTDSIVVTNNGTKSLTISSVTAMSNDFVVSPTSATIAKKSAEKFSITFTPTSVGSKNSSIKFVYDAPSSPASVVVSGRGAAGQFSSSKATIAFNALTVGETQRDSFTVANIGNLRLRITSILSSSDQFYLSAAYDSIEPNSTKKFSVTFAPTTAGEKTSTVTFTHNGVGGQSTMTLTGFAGAPMFSLSANAISFGSITTSRTKVESLTVSNPGSAVLVISSVSSSNSAFTVTPTSAVIPNGANNTKKFYVTFTPNGMGNYNGGIVFTYNIISSPTSVAMFANAFETPGKMAEFNGNSSKIEVANNTALQFTNTFTLEAWMYPRKLTASAGIISKRHTFNTSGYFLALRTTSPNSGINANGVETPAGKIEENKWHHVAVTTSGKNVNIYINGSLAKSGMMSDPISSTIDPLYFGVNFANKYFDGFIDEVRLWNVVRTQAQIQSSMNVALKGNESGLVAYYRLDEVDGGIVANVTGGLSGTLNGVNLVSSDAPIESPSLQLSTNTITYGLSKAGITKSENVTLTNIGTKSLVISSITSENSEFTTSPSNGTILPGESMNLTISYTPALSDEDSANISIEHNAPRSPRNIFVKGRGYEASSQNNSNLNSVSLIQSSSFSSSGEASDSTLKQFTVAMWLNPSFGSLTQSGYLTILGNFASVGLTTDKNLVFNLKKQNFSNAEVTIPYAMSGWHHFAASVEYNSISSSTIVKLYVDGQLVKTKNYQELLRSGPVKPNISIGLYYVGYLDEYSLWNKALSAKEIQEAMRFSSATMSSASENLLAYYPFSETSGNNVSDASGNNRNGLFTNVTHLPFGAPLGMPFIHTNSGELASHNFGNIYTTASSSLNASMTNTGDLPLHISSFVASDSDVVISGLDTAEFLTGQTRNFTMTFAPKKYQDYNVTVSLTDNAERSPRNITVTGRGIGTTTLTTPLTLTFGSVPYGVPTEKKFAVTNSGSAPVYITGVVESYAGSPVFVCSPTNLMIPAGQTDSINVAFTPDAIEYSATSHKIVISTLNAGTKEIPVSGKGIYNGSLVVEQKVIDFGTVDAFFAKRDSATITNGGGGLLTITGYSSSPDVVVQGPPDVSGGETLKVYVKFKPKGAGTRSGKIYISYLKANATGGTDAAIDSSLTFTGVAVYGPLVNADNAITNSVTAKLSEGNKLRFDSAFTFEAWVKPNYEVSNYYTNTVLLDNKGGIVIALKPSKVSTTRSDSYNSTTNYTGFSVSAALNNNSSSAEFGKQNVSNKFEYYPYGKDNYSYGYYGSGGGYSYGYGYGGYSNYYGTGYYNSGGYSSYYSYSSSYYSYVGYTQYETGSIGSIPHSVWSHLAVTWSKGDSLRVYKNGNLLGSAYMGNENIAYTSSDLIISPFPAGMVDEVVFWNYARSQNQIISSFNNGLESPEGLESYWKFTEGSGRTAGDVTGNGNTLTLNNTVNWSRSTLPVANAALMDSMKFDFGLMNSAATSPIAKNIILLKKAKDTRILPVRAELSDTTNFQINNSIVGVGELGDNISIGFTAKSEGEKTANVILYNATTNDSVGKLSLKGKGVRPKVTGKINQTSTYSYYSSYSYSNSYSYYYSSSYSYSYSYGYSYGYSYSSYSSRSTTCFGSPVTIYLRDLNQQNIAQSTSSCEYEFKDLVPGKYFLYVPPINSYYYNNNGYYYYFSGFGGGYIGRADVTMDKVEFGGFDLTLYSAASFYYSGLKNKTNSVIEWTDPATWGSQLPKDTMDISVAYPGLYDQLEVNLNLTALNNYCNVNTCDGDVTSQRNVTIMDSAKMTVNGSGAWNVNGILSVNGDLTINADSTATITIGELQVGGKLLIPADKNPTIIINGGFVCSGTFEPGKATIILNGENLNYVSAPAFGNDSTKRTLEIYNLIMNSDSTLISDNVRILHQLTLNSDIRFADSLNDFFDAFDTLFIASSLPNAITGTGTMKTGIIKRTIDQSEPGTYRFHTPSSVVRLTSSNNLPTSLTVTKVAGTVPANQYLAVKEGTIDNEGKSVSITSVNPIGYWGFGSPTYQDGDVRGGPFYTISAEGSQTVTGNISLGYDAGLLNGLDETSLALLKVSSGIRVRNVFDADANVESDSDRVLSPWEIKIYQGSVAEENLLSSQTGEEILLDDVKSGDYIIVPTENIHYRTILRTISGFPFVDSTNSMSVTVPDGVLMDVIFVRMNVVTITAEAGPNGTIIPSGVTEVAANSVVEFNVIPDFGYRIADVQVDGISVGNNDTFIFEGVAENHEIVATFVFDDNVLFRTFSADVNLSKKATKIAYKKGKLVTVPNLATAVEAEFKKLGKSGATFLGVPQTIKADAKKYAWIAYKTAATLGKLYTSAHSENYYPLDTLRGTKKKAMYGLVKADRKTHNNKTFEQAVAFKLNLLASEDSITPPNFGALILDTSLTLAGKELQGMMLTDISLYLDTVMTYWKNYGVDDDTAYTELKSVINVLQRINDGFAAPISATNHTIGDVLVAKKNPYAITLSGVKRASEVGIVKFVAGKTRTTRHIVKSEIPEEFALYQNYPNPFNPTTTIRFDLPKSAIVSLKIYNILGQEITTLLSKQEYDEGQYEVVFDASTIATGVYFYRLDVNNEFTEVKKLLLLK